jgi:ribosomal protein L30/L7E
MHLISDREGAVIDINESELGEMKQLEMLHPEDLDRLVPVPNAKFYVSTRASALPKGIELPLEGTPAFNRARGREGDLIVIQLKSGIGQSPDRRAALRSLTLKGPWSTSLRLSYDAATWGNIRKVRDLVAVVALPEVKYKSGHNPESADSGIKYENFKYGSRNLPAHLWRDSSGEYFGYGLVAFWSSEVSIENLETSLNQTGLQIDIARRDAFLATAQFSPEFNEPLVVPHTGSWESISKNLLSSTVISARLPLRDNLAATWLAPHKRYEDQDHVKGTVGIISPRTEVLAIRGLARVTGNVRFLDVSHCAIITGVRGKGKRREFVI